MPRADSDTMPVDDFMRRNVTPNRWDVEHAAFIRERTFAAAILDKQAHFIDPKNLSPGVQRRTIKRGQLKGSSPA